MTEISEEYPVLLTIPQVSRRLGICRNSTYNLVGSGQLEAVHIGRSVRVPVDAVADFVARARAAGAVSTGGSDD